MCVYVGFYIPLQWVHHLWLLFVLPPHQDWPNKVQYLQTQCVCCFHLIDPEYLRHLVHMKWAWLAPVLLLGQIINIYCLKTQRGEYSFHSCDQSLDGHSGYRDQIDCGARPANDIKKSSLLSSPWKSPPVWPTFLPLAWAAQLEMPWRVRNSKKKSQLKMYIKFKMRKIM